MRVALYYPKQQGGVARRVREIQSRSRHDVKIVDRLDKLDEFDVVHSYADHYMGEVHTCAGHLRQAKDYYHRRSRYVFKFIPKGLKEIYKLKGFKAVISRSNAEQKWLKRWDIDSHLIQAGVDLTRFLPIYPDDAQEPDKGERTVIFVGRLEEAKGLHLLLRAADHLPSNHKLVIIGDGKLRSTAETYPRTILYGHVTHDRVVSFLQSADVLCLPSYTESFPLVVLEAMACGIPVVGTDVGDVREMIQPPLGGYICTYDPKDIAEKIMRATSGGEEYRCRELASRYPWEATVSKVENVWESIDKEEI
jgi:glycosyltransferase involved in cell wall biosynthesis